MRFVLLKSAESLDMQSLHRVRDPLIGERRRAPGHAARARVTAHLGRRKFHPALAALRDDGVVANLPNLRQN
jgi:hypothetical protein